ncbi:hypothetical protein MYSTI_05423 [Myxococcus stipitatus DSM 14675]|uniref:Lipoprotein n=1 Tax=Myxococcus stipitatus (strain DSM 14675 / JCM 12634 / Mx s8) TaxID=1278073 RepID=L7UGK2_MYXSD|nr:hypothetical protein [Myxococcus stipitatus]AGC46702.1 hypothetical protein MYSTI_05423 [Myxococcus stipitatus DSM 14675]
MKAWGRFCARAVLCCGFGWASAAGAHELTCEKKVNGAPVVVASTFPFIATYSFKVTNVHPTLPSILLSATDSILTSEGFEFTPAPPVSIPVSGSLTSFFPLTIDSFSDCKLLAILDGTDDLSIDNVFTATFEGGVAICSARVVCEQPPPPPECTHATRTLGFYKTHIPALEQCLALGPIPLGAIGTITTLPSAEGILWGDPAKYPDDTPRSQLDRLRFLLARQTLVATCNQRLFGATPTPPTLITAAVTALNGTDCTAISALIPQVDAFNNSCDAASFPPGFVPGPATPQLAESIAVDPTSSSGQTCSP